MPKRSVKYKPDDNLMEVLNVAQQLALDDYTESEVTSIVTPFLRQALLTNPRLEERLSEHNWDMQHGFSAPVNIHTLLTALKMYF